MSWNHSPIFLPIPLTMQMIKHNKETIRGMEEDVKYLQQQAAFLWSQCDPNRASSIVDYEYLNKTKDRIRYLKKKIKMLAEMQSYLKYSIR